MMPALIVGIGTGQQIGKVRFCHREWKAQVLKVYNVSILRVTVFVLGMFGMINLIGIYSLLILGKQVPNELYGLMTTIGGIFGGLLINTAKSSETPPPTPHSEKNSHTPP